MVCSTRHPAAASINTNPLCGRSTAQSGGATHDALPSGRSAIEVRRAPASAKHGTNLPEEPDYTAGAPLMAGIGTD